MESRSDRSSPAIPGDRSRPGDGEWAHRRNGEWAKPETACCPIRFVQYVRVTKTEDLLQKATKGGSVWIWLSIRQPFVCFCEKPSVFVTFVIFPYCDLRF